MRRNQISEGLSSLGAMFVRQAQLQRSLKVTIGEFQRLIGVTDFLTSECGRALINTTVSCIQGTGQFLQLADLVRVDV